MRYFSSLATKNMKARKLRTFLTFSGVVLGVAVILSVSIAGTSALRGYERMINEVSGKANLQVTTVSLTGFEENIVGKARNTPGVKAAAASISYVGFVYPKDTSVQKNERYTLEIIGVDPKIDRQVRDYRIIKGNFLNQNTPDSVLLTDEFASNNKISLGQTIKIAGVGVIKKFKVSGLIGKTGAGRAENGKVVYVCLSTAQKLFNSQGEVNTIDIKIKEGFKTNQAKSKLAKKLGEEFEVLRPTTRTSDVENLLSSYQLALNFFSIMALFVGAFLIFNTFSMNITERTHEIGILRSIGATRGQILRVVVAEALVLGILGSGVGLLLGIGLAKINIAAMADYLQTELGTLVVPSSSLLFAFFLGIGVTLISAIQPALKASKTSPLTAIQTSTATQSNLFAKISWLVGIAFIALGTFLAVYGVTTTGLVFKNSILITQIGTLIVLLGFPFLLPSLMVPLSKILGWPVKIAFRTEGMLAMRNMSRSRVRTALTVLTLMVGLIMVIGIEAMSLSYKVAVTEWVDSSVGADFFVHSVLSRGMMLGKASPMPLELMKEIEKVKGVAYVSPVKIIPARAFGKTISFVAFDPYTLPKVSGTLFIKGDEKEGINKTKKGGYILVSTVLSEKHDLQIGDKIKIKTPKGEKEFKIAGVISDFSNNQGSVRGSWKDLEKYFNVNEPTSFDIKIKTSSNPKEVKKRLEEKIGKKYGLEVWSSRDFHNEVDRIVKQAFGLMDSIVYIAIIVAVLAVINTLTMNVLERTREIGVLRSTGAIKRQVAKIVLAEAAIIGVIGGALGILGGVFASAIMVRATIVESGFPLSYSFPTIPMISAGIVSVVISMLAGLYPARKAARTNIIEALSYE